jgi:hypothetical protein
MKTITDGSAVFTVRDKRIQAMIDMFYPVGSMYISADKSKTKADFPFMAYGTWEEVPANLCLQTGNASEAGTQRNAGLPNITGQFIKAPKSTNNGHELFDEADGAFQLINPKQRRPVVDTEENYTYVLGQGCSFNAALSNPIYGASNTVQPPTYMVRAWIRTA